MKQKITHKQNQQWFDPNINMAMAAIKVQGKKLSCIFSIEQNSFIAAALPALPEVSAEGKLGAQGALIWLGGL